jgi:hypothetical protein
MDGSQTNNTSSKMKMPGIFKTKKAEETILAILVVASLLILPSLPLGKYGGGIAMVAGSVVGLIAYFVLFGERLRVCPGSVRRAIAIAMVAASVAAALAVWLVHGNWR